ncbi:MAG: TonB-dependent receptor, partial [Gammaproteobacteria bacterium]|nr:TonB-dependent receptor [Gammaproteobacteria bacterium]
SFRRSALAVAVLSNLFSIGQVAAQEDGLVLEEVIVTARKRQESLQQTPVAVTALNAAALRDAGVRNLYDLNQIAPNIEVQSANGNAPLANIYIRGIGQRNTGPNIDSGIGIYIDNVYIGRPDGALLDINDIASVQVLRGPQGTLFGKNTTGGALVFTTNRPQEEFEGSVELRVGNYSKFDSSTMLNVPLTDTLLSRVSVTTTSRDGYIDNHFDGEEYMDEDRINVIGQLRWLASDTLTLDLNYNYADTDQKARPQKCLPVPGAVGWQAALFDIISVIPSTGRTYDDFCQDAADIGDDLDVISDLGGKYESENQGLSLTVEWEVGDDYLIKSVSAWRSTDAGQDDELDHTALPWLHRTQLVHPSSHNRETDQYSQELEFSGSAFNDRMQFVTGAYWFSEKTDDNQAANFIGPFDPGIVNFFMLNTTSTLLEADNEAWAVFSQVEWSWTDNWRTTLGIRYTDEDRELYRERYAVVPETLDKNGGFVIPVFNGAWAVDRTVFEYNPDFSYALNNTSKESVGDDDTSFMASIQYLIDEWNWIDTGSVYLTYSEGFLSGGLSEAPTGELETFEPEEVENWELGFKLDMLDRRLRVNGALFYADYTNRQLTTIVVNLATNSPAGATINAKSSTIAGFELETTWLATANLEISFNATFNDGDIDKFEDTQILIADPLVAPEAGCTRVNLSLIQVDQCPKDRSNENLPRLPEETYYLAAQYSWQSDWGTFMPRIQGSLKKDIDYCFDSLSCDTGLWLEDEQFDLSARVTWLSNDGNWVGAIYGTNLTDENYLVGGTALVESAGVGGYSVAAPRMYGAELKYSF